MKFRIGDFVYATVARVRARRGVLRGTSGFGTILEHRGSKCSIYPYPEPDGPGVDELEAEQSDVRKAYLTHYGPVFQRKRTEQLARGRTTW